jgi:DNA-directed RNA polymerase specialized sigma24 family protein
LRSRGSSRSASARCSGTAWLLTGDWALAEDLVQTALIRSWPRWERITRRDDPEIYVLRVTPKRHEQSGSAE